MLSEPARREFTMKESKKSSQNEKQRPRVLDHITRLGDEEACYLESEAKPKFLAQIEANMVQWLCWGWLVTFMTNLKRKVLKMRNVTTASRTLFSCPSPPS